MLVEKTKITVCQRWGVFWAARFRPEPQSAADPTNFGSHCDNDESFLHHSAQPWIFSLRLEGRRRCIFSQTEPATPTNQRFRLALVPVAVLAVVFLQSFLPGGGILLLPVVKGDNRLLCIVSINFIPLFRFFHSSRPKHLRSNLSAHPL